MVEMPSAPVVENMQTVFAVSFIALAPCGFHRANASLVASTGQLRRKKSVSESIHTVDVLQTLVIFEDCVNAILRWTRQVVFLRRCHVQSHPERTSSPAQL